MGRVIDLAIWRRRRRYDAPAKDNVLAASDAMLAARLQEMQLPDPPQRFRERNRRAYGEWLGDRGSRNRWRN